MLTSKISRYDGSDARRILRGMITDRVVCARIATQWKDEGLFDSQWANLVGGLVIRHYQKYNSPPNDQLTAIFEDWATSTTADEKTVDAVERFIRFVQDEPDAECSDYLLDLAGRYFNRVNMKKEIQAAELELENREDDKAQTRIENIRRINLGVGSYVVPSADPSLWAELIHNERMKPLVTYKEGLGDFIGDAFFRGAFYAFMAPDKTGKTTWLVDLAYRAVRQRNRVVFFDLGDSTQNEVITRFACRASNKPDRACTLKLPESWDGDEPVFCEKRLDAVDEFDAFREFRRICKSEDAFRVSCHDNSSLSVADIDGLLETWDREENWRPDVIVLDYADILAPPKGYKDPIDQIDEMWKHLRRLSQKRHALVVTATQSNASVYGKEAGLLSRRHFSGRKTKLAHVNGMLGINVTPEEKANGMARINWIVRRRGAYNEKSFVRVAGNYAIGNPAIRSKR